VLDLRTAPGFELNLRLPALAIQRENLAVNGKLIALLAGVLILVAIPIKLFVFSDFGAKSDGVQLVSADTQLGDAADGGATRSVAAGDTVPATRVKSDKPTASWEEVIRTCEESVAVVKGKIGHGTGFLLPNNVLATNAHVINLEFEENLRVYFPSAPKKKQGPFKAHFLWADRRRDLAFLGVECDVNNLELAEDYQFSKGQEVIAIGNPGIGGTEMLPNAVSRGMMSVVKRLDKHEFYQLNIAVNPGNSGGPILDRDGRVLGMITAKLRDKDGIAFAIPIHDLERGYAEVVGQGWDTTPELMAWHRGCTVLERLVQVGDLYIAALDANSKAMDAAVARGLSPNAGLHSVPEQVRKDVQVINKIFGDNLEKNVVLTINEANLYPEDKERIRQLWDVVREMKRNYDTPSGTVDSYRARKNFLRLKFEKLLSNDQPRKPPKKQ